MKENMELERGDIAIDRDMEVDSDIGQEILAYVETWFDADKKFGIHTADDDGTWLNLYPQRYEACAQKGFLDHSGFSEYRGFFDSVHSGIH